MQARKWDHGCSKLFRQMKKLWHGDACAPVPPEYYDHEELYNRIS